MTLHCLMPKLGLALTPAPAFGGFWVSDGVHQAAQWDSPGQGQHKEKNQASGKFSNHLCSKILESASVSQRLQLSLLSISYFISLQLFNYADSSLQGFASHSQTSTLLYGVHVSVSSYIITHVKLHLSMSLS